VQLTALNAATKPDDLSAPGWRLHPLAGSLKRFYSITVNGNWRVIFRFDGTDVELVDYLDYHSRGKFSANICRSVLESMTPRSVSA
jgi:toxin HigB-1